MNKPVFMPGGEEVPGSRCDTPQGHCACGQVHLLSDWSNQEEILTWFPPKSLPAIKVYEIDLRLQGNPYGQILAKLTQLEARIHQLEKKTYA